jgi:diketogulonate reductase-like aldo/keto reductase
MRKYVISANQVNYGITHRTIEPHLLPYCREHKITIIAFSSLGHDYASLLKADPRGALGKVAQETGKTRAQVALNWATWPDNVVTIPKTESSSHMAENCQSSDWRLSSAQKEFLDRSVNFRSRTRMESAVRRAVRGTLQRWQQRKLDKSH